MKELNFEQMAQVEGGSRDTCKDVTKAMGISCALTMVPFWGPLLAGPTCLGTAIGYAIGC